VEGVGGRTPTVTEGTQDASISAVRMKRGVKSMEKGAIPQTLTKPCKHPLRPFLVKTDVGKLPIWEQSRAPSSLLGNNLTPEHKIFGNLAGPIMVYAL